jgi:hypothetical protein
MRVSDGRHQNLERTANGLRWDVGQRAGRNHGRRRTRLRSRYYQLRNEGLMKRTLQVDGQRKVARMAASGISLQRGARLGAKGESLP